MSTSDEVNPYEAPKASSKRRKREKAKGADGFDYETEAAIESIQESLRKTRPWITLFGTLTYIGAAALVLFGIASLAMPMGRSSMLASLGPLIFIVYLVMAVLYGLIGARLFRYRDSINQVLLGDGRLDLVATAIERQREFWSFVGMMTVVLLGFYLIAILGGLLFALGR